MCKENSFVLATLVVCLSLNIQDATSQKVGLGGCPDYLGVGPIDWKKTEGRWYEIYSGGTKYTEGEGRCRLVTYDNFNSTDNSIEVTTYLTKDKKEYNYGKGTTDKNGNGIVEVEYPGFLRKYKYSWINSDFSNYALVFSCEQIAFTHVYSVFVWGRRPYFSSWDEEKVLTTVKKWMGANGLDWSIMEKTNQTACCNGCKSL